MDPPYEVFSAPADGMPARAAGNSESLSSSKMTANVRDKPKTLRSPIPALEVGKLGKAKTGKEGAACSKVRKSSSDDACSDPETSGSDSMSSSGYETEGTSIFSVNQHEGEGTSKTIADIEATSNSVATIYRDRQEALSRGGLSSRGHDTCLNIQYDLALSKFYCLCDICRHETAAEDKSIGEIREDKEEVTPRGGCRRCGDQPERKYCSSCWPCSCEVCAWAKSDLRNCDYDEVGVVGEGGEDAVGMVEGKEKGKGGKTRGQRVKTPPGKSDSLGTVTGKVKPVSKFEVNKFDNLEEEEHGDIVIKDIYSEPILKVQNKKMQTGSSKKKNRKQALTEESRQILSVNTVEIPAPANPEMGNVGSLTIARPDILTQAHHLKKQTGAAKRRRRNLARKAHPYYHGFKRFAVSFLEMSLCLRHPVLAVASTAAQVGAFVASRGRLNVHPMQVVGEVVRYVGRMVKRERRVIGWVCFVGLVVVGLGLAVFGGLL